MKDGDGLNDVLGYARPVKGNQHSEYLSKLYLETVKSTKTVEAADKKNGKNEKAMLTLYIYQMGAILKISLSYWTGHQVTSLTFCYDA